MYWPWGFGVKRGLSQCHSVSFLTLNAYAYAFVLCSPQRINAKEKTASLSKTTNATLEWVYHAPLQVDVSIFRYGEQPTDELELNGKCDGDTDKGVVSESTQPYMIAELH